MPQIPVLIDEEDVPVIQALLAVRRTLTHGRIEVVINNGRTLDIIVTKRQRIRDFTSETGDKASPSHTQC